MNLDSSVLRCLERGLREEEQTGSAGTTTSGGISLVLRLGAGGECGTSNNGGTPAELVELPAVELCRSLLRLRLEDPSSAAGTISHLSSTTHTMTLF